MNRIRQYIIPLTTSVLALVFIFAPLITFAESDPNASFIQKLVWNVLVALTGMILYLSGAIFDYAVNALVLGFADVFSKSGIGFAVDRTWVTIRDFVNLSFIFGLVYIGFKMILDSDDSNTRRWLVNLIIAALLVNFSLFITKFVIDLSNQISTQIAVSTFCPNGDFTQCDTGEIVKGYPKSIKIEAADNILRLMGLAGIFDIKGVDLAAASWGYIFGAALMFLVAGFTLAAGAILLIIRFAMLNLFMVMSPFMFIGWILPPLSNLTSRYWNAFLKRAFFAPVYFLFLYFSLEILKAFHGYLNVGGSPSVAKAFQSNNTGAATEAAAGSLPIFILVCIFLIASIVISQKLGADGADTAIKYGQMARQKLQRGVIKTGKFTAAQTGGRAARAATNAAGGALDRGLRRIQESQTPSRLRRFARSNAVQGTVGGAASKLQNTKFGLSRTVEEEQRMRSQTETRANNAVAISAGLDAQKKLEAINTGKIRVNNRGIIVEEDLATMTDARKAELGLTELTSVDPQVKADAQKKAEGASEKMQRLAADMTIKDFEAMSEEQQEQIAEFIGGSLTENIAKSDKISDTQKTKINEKQQNAILKSIKDENGNIITESLSNLSIRQLETLGDEFISQNAAYLTDNQFSDIKKSKKFTEGQVNRYANKRKADLGDMVKNSPEKVFTQTYRDQTTGTIQQKAKKTSEIAKLPGNVLADPNAVKYLTVDVLKAIASGDKEFERVSTQQREAILNNLENQMLLPQTLDSKVAKALHYLHSPKGQEDFIGIT